MRDQKLTKESLYTKIATKFKDLGMNVLNIEYKSILAIWSESDDAADNEDCMAVTLEGLIMDGAIVKWVCEKQTEVSLLTMKAKFASVSHVGRKLLVLRKLMCKSELKVDLPMSLLMDSLAAIRQLKTEGNTSTFRHVDIRNKRICDHATNGIVTPKIVESRLMMSDRLTKVLLVQQMAELRELLNTLSTWTKITCRGKRTTTDEDYWKNRKTVRVCQIWAEQPRRISTAKVGSSDERFSG